MAKLQLLISLILILTLSYPALAETEKTGTASFSFLKLQGSVRAASLGDTFVAIADDASAVLVNPAGLSQLKEGEFQTAYHRWLSGINYSSAIYARPVGRLGTVGGSISYVNFGDIEETTRVQPQGTGRDFNSSGSLYVLSYAVSPLPWFSVGVAYKSFQQSLDQSVKSGSVYDAGLLWKIHRNIRAGLTVENIGEALPSKRRFGLSARLFKERLLLAGEVSQPSDNIPTYHVGVECRLTPFLTLRGGGKTSSEEKAGSRWSLGLGLNLRGLKINYAYVPYEELGATHRIGLGF